MIFDPGSLTRENVEELIALLDDTLISIPVCDPIVTPPELRERVQSALFYLIDLMGRQEQIEQWIAEKRKRYGLWDDELAQGFHRSCDEIERILKSSQR